MATNTIKTEMAASSNSTTLYKKIVSRQNIYNSIYCLESYVFEKGLLDTNSPVVAIDGKILADNDLSLFFSLSDKYKFSLITKVIELCEQRLDEILKSEDELFDVTVYFKIKDKDEKNGELKFRPMHTARLTDMICMVCILNILMFEDDEKAGRRYSELSKMIPHNFFGNIPSVDVGRLFCRWQNKYKEYTESFLKHCKKYQKSHQYLTEVNLDIQNFFPSVNPQIVYDFITEHLSTSFPDESDMKVLKMAVTKLLFFNIKPENLKDWENVYYGTDRSITATYHTNCGIPQGLPQAYFFGNLVMIKIKDIMMSSDLFDGDAYFYVDDSVIYVPTALDEDEFNKRIKTLNEKLRVYCTEACNPSSDIGRYVNNNYLDFHSNLDYIIKFHPNGKSMFCVIDEANNHLDGLYYFDHCVSDVWLAAISLDEIDDQISLDKLEAFDKVITNRLEKLQEKDDDNPKVSSQIKVLQRFRKFFLYRNRLLQIRTGNRNLDDLKEDFNKYVKDIDEWIKCSKDEIFQSEYRLLISLLSNDEADKIRKTIMDFEKGEVKKEYCYFTKDTDSSIKMRLLSRQPYQSLIEWAIRNYRYEKRLNESKIFEKFTDFVNEMSSTDSVDNFKDLSSIVANDAKFVFKHSSEFKRMILNTVYSYLSSIQPLDAHSFTKDNSRRIKYSEIRLLAYLRNKRFEYTKFCEFFQKISKRDLSDTLDIDMCLLEVLSYFIACVKDPDKVDDLILTHRVTKSLWTNGSKFLHTYTLHNEEHAVTLVKQSLHLIKTIDYFSLKSLDYYILFLSCYLHDISMVLHPDMYGLLPIDAASESFVSSSMTKMKKEVDNFFKIDKKNSTLKNSGSFLVNLFNDIYSYYENYIRSNHPDESAKFIRSKSNDLFSYIEPTILSFVANVSAAHGYDSIDVFGLRSKAKDDVISLKYLMIILRLADLMDASKDRVNYYLLRQNVEYMPSLSRFHWISHLVTDSMVLEAEYETSDDTETSTPITEKLLFTVNLNVKYLNSTKKGKKCDRWKCQNENNSFKIEISDNGCQQTYCPFLCHWMVKKHEWLLPELSILLEYLKKVNNTMIKTEISFIIRYRDEEVLDSDMFDYVSELINKGNDPKMIHS